MQKSMTAATAEVSGDALNGHRMGPATYRKRARPQLVKTLIATVERSRIRGVRRRRISTALMHLPQRQGGRKVPRGGRCSNVGSSYLPQVALETLRRICGGTAFQARALMVLVSAVPAFAERETAV